MSRARYSCYESIKELENFSTILKQAMDAKDIKEAIEVLKKVYPDFPNTGSEYVPMKTLEPQCGKGN